MIHQYRCETCKYHEDIKDAVYNTIWCKEHDTTLNPSIIVVVGCASHSDAKTIQCTVCGSEATHPHCNICFGLAMAMHRQEERETVLDKILKDLSGDNPDVTDCNTTDEWYGHGWDDCREHITEYIKKIQEGR